MSDRINAGGYLLPGQSIVSQDGRYTLNFQASDHNVVLYRTGGPALWATNTPNGAATNLAMQGADGNLVLNGAHWASNTAGHPGAFLVIQNDGNLVIYDASGTHPLWASNTVQKAVYIAYAGQGVCTTDGGGNPRTQTGSYFHVSGEGFTHNGSCTIRANSDGNIQRGIRTVPVDKWGKFDIPCFWADYPGPGQVLTFVALDDGDHKSVATTHAP
ncbi:hypothetical protein [Limnoglobus roseus]|uniref:Bulb-type lectin domain-containing protein n=1 Tax=Limnoglobus roseus TaxID=2598579 RepID=A0A5C1AB26_9BACT|nr:hypothetical protein [Limnoglobus roseus]QEL14334.1 hypothetical protein PX52LOC_01222 [Limnoglobus roseus]